MNPCSYLSVQLMQGSMVSTILGTSASWQPFKATTPMGAILAKVGVLTLKRCKNFVPLPFKVIHDFAARGLFGLMKLSLLPPEDFPPLLTSISVIGYFIDCLDKSNRRPDILPSRRTRHRASNRPRFQQPVPRKVRHTRHSRVFWYRRQYR